MSVRPYLEVILKKKIHSSCVYVTIGPLPANNLDRITNLFNFSKP